MYLTIEETAAYLDLSVDHVVRLIQQGDIRYLIVDEELLIYREQFNGYLNARDAHNQELQRYFSEPLPEDPDIKDED